MTSERNSSAKQPSLRRLIDPSIWIAFYRIGRLEALLRLPGIAIARPAVRELRLGTDDLSERVQKALGDDCFDVDISGGVSDTLSDILSLRDRRLSEADSSQVAYATQHSHCTVLYVRDGPAERQARGIGAPVRSHLALVEDMIKLKVISQAEALRLQEQLEAYYGQRRSRRHRR